jgi:hypothetical protein
MHITTDSSAEIRDNVMIKSHQAFRKTKDVSTSTLQQTFRSLAIETIATLKAQAPSIIEAQLSFCTQHVSTCPMDLGQQKCICLLSAPPYLDAFSKKDGS